jgi:hypothetical protein
MVSGSLSPPYSGYFSPFPHGTGPLSVSQEYLALPDGAGRFRRDSSGPALLRIPLRPKALRRRGSHPLWPAFPGGLASSLGPTSRSYNPGGAVTPPVWAAPLSLATTQGITLVFSSSGYLDVSVPRVRPPVGVLRLHRSGLPHSDTRGSKGMCPSPRLIAACRVLHRL